jgi:hypothetical protein
MDASPLERFQEHQENTRGEAKKNPVIDAAKSHKKASAAMAQTWRPRGNY